jgi:Xaa-Pro aminopeptidase
MDAASMSDRTNARRERLRRLLRDAKTESLLVASDANVRYLTGFEGGHSTLLVTRDRDIIISDGRYTTELARDCPDIERHIREIGQPMPAGIAEVVSRLAVRVVAFEASSVTYGEFEALRSALSAVELKPTSGQVESLRMRKDEQELDLIRAAIGVAERALTMLRAGLRPDETEKDVTDQLDGYLRRCGAGAASFTPIVAVGAHAAFPHHHASHQTRIGEADFVLVDWGADVRGYKSDLTRVIATGKVTPKFEAVYRAVLAAQERGIAAIRPGVKARDVDAEARSVLEEAGFGTFFSHGLGHGLGLEIHEAPWLRKESEVVLEPGMVVTVEPGVYLPDWGGIRIEDVVLVTPDGAEILTSLPKALESVRLRDPWHAGRPN